MKTGKRVRTILLVCDEGSLCEVFKKVLEAGGGYEVELLSDVGAARAALAEANYDIVIVNIVNDPAEATEFCQEMKAASPAQLFAFLAGRWSYIPPDSCPDKVLPKDEGPQKLLAMLREVVVPDPPLETDLA